MIYCEVNDIVLETDATCIARQRKLAEIKEKYTSRRSIIPDGFFMIRKCVGCKIGEKLYREAQKK